MRREYLHQLPLVEDAYARRALALLRQLDTACANAEDLATATITLFRIHRDATIITSQPGLGELTGARVLAEDRRRPDPLQRRPRAQACVPRNSDGLEAMILGLAWENASRHASEACL